MGMIYRLYCYICDRVIEINEDSGTCPECGTNLLHCTDYEHRGLNG